MGCFWSWGFFLNIWYCMNRDGCIFFSLVCSTDTMFLFFSWPSASWEREVGILPLNSGTTIVLFDSFSVTCNPYISCFGFGILFWEKKKIPVSHFCFMYWLFKLNFGIKIKPILSSRGNLSEVTEFCLKYSHLRHNNDKKPPLLSDVLTYKS